MFGSVGALVGRYVSKSASVNACVPAYSSLHSCFCVNVCL